MPSPFYRPLKDLRIAQPQVADSILKGMEFNDRSRRTDIAEDRNAIARENLDLRQQGLDQNKAQQELANGLRFLGSATIEEYPAIVKWLDGFDLPTDLLPKPENVTPENFPRIIEQIMVGGKYAAERGVEALKQALKMGEDERKKQAQIEKENRAEAVQIRKEKRAEDRETPTKAELISPLLRDYRDGKPIEEFSENEQKLLKPEIDKEGTKEGEEEKTLRIYEAKLRIKEEFEAERPEDYHESLKNATDAIMGGADPKEIYYKMIKEFPEQATELEKMLFTPSGAETLQALIELFGNK